MPTELVDEPRGWDSPLTADRYAGFARTHPMYRVTSASLVERAGLAPDSAVLDLCAGTGVTTHALLQALGPDGRVYGLDGSAAMLEEARRGTDDQRVQWVHGRAEELAALVPAGLDAVVCNSAIWQTDMPATFAAVRQVLRPGGRFVCNIGRQFLIMPFTEQELAPRTPGLLDLMSALAVLDHGYVPPRGGFGGGLTPDRVTAMLLDAGLEPAEPEVVAVEQSAQEHYGWLQVPVFTERFLPGLPYDVRMSLLDQAFARLDRDQDLAPQRWVVFAATAPQSSPE